MHSRPNLAILFIMALLSAQPVWSQMNMPMPQDPSPNSSPKPDKPAQAQSDKNMPGMNMPGMNMGPTVTLRENILRHSTSGTDAEPDSTTPPMLMQMRGPWMLMLHGQASIVEQQQIAPRGSRAADKLFSTNWIMPMAQRQLGPGQLTLRAMLSLEPATISGRYYPELFQQGETAFGRPIIDGQHPHNFFMELAGLYDFKLGNTALLSLYAAPVGDPALGPVAYPHRASASEDPLAPLGHHLQDSTHIADEVLTGGLIVSKIRIEASGFHGREPGENRWIISVGGLDSWSARLTAAATRDVTAQYSIGHLHSPESQHPGEDVLRQTASIAYHHAWNEETGQGTNSSRTSPIALDALALWGRNHTIASPENANSYLFETTAHLGRQSLWTRVENVDRTTDLLGATAPSVEKVIGRVQAYTAGYAYQVHRNSWSAYEVDAQYTLYETPGSLRSLYGNHPQGIAVELNIRLGRKTSTREKSPN